MKKKSKSFEKQPNRIALLLVAFLSTTVWNGSMNYPGGITDQSIAQGHECSQDLTAYGFGNYGSGNYGGIPSVCGNGICQEGENALNCPEDCSVPADFDMDGDVDQEDFGQFQACYSGPGIGCKEGCKEADFDDDSDVDLDDFEVFQGCMGGANKLPEC